MDVFLVENCVDPWIVTIRSSFSNSHGSWQDFILSGLLDFCECFQNVANEI